MSITITGPETFTEDAQRLLARITELEKYGAPKRNIPISEIMGWKGRKLGELSKEELINEVIHHLLVENKELKDRYLKVDRFVLVDHTTHGQGRIFDSDALSVQLMVQDEGRTLKARLTGPGRKHR